MFPWLNFVEHPAPRQRRRFFSNVVKGDLVCSVQVFNYIPPCPANAITVVKEACQSRASVSPVQSTDSARTPRSCASPQQPTSARDKPIFKPPPEPRVTRNQRKGLETSSAMLELFGGGGPVQTPPKLFKPETPLINDTTCETKVVESASTGTAPFQGQPSLESKHAKGIEMPEKHETNTVPAAVAPSLPAPTDANAEPAPVAVQQTEPPTEIPASSTDGQITAGSSVCFQTINHPEQQKRFGRSNVLEREMKQISEWEEVRSLASAGSAFQTVEDHAAKYAESVKRAAWTSSSSHFNVVNSGGSDIFAQPGPEKFDDELAPECAESSAMPIGDEEDENEATVSDEFIPDDGQHRTHSSERNYESKDTGGCMQLSNPGPELADDDEERESAAGQKVAMDAMGSEGTCEDHGIPNADELIATAQKEAEFAQGEELAASTAIPTTGCVDDSDGVLGTPIAAAGLSGGSGGNTNYTNNSQKSDSGNVNGKDSSGNMVSLNGGGSGTGSGGAGGGGGSGTGSGGGGGAEKVVLVKGGQIINDDSIFIADVLIEDGTIKQVSPSLIAPENAEVIDASGFFILPAGIDVHTEFSTPGSIDDFIIGSKSALAGGTATIIDVVLPRPEDTLLTAFDRTKQEIGSRCVCNYALSVVIPKWTDATKSEMDILVREKGVNSFILDLFSDTELYAAFEHAKQLGAHVRILPENRSISLLLEKKLLKNGVTGPEGYVQSRPAQLEADRIQHVATLSEITNCPVAVLSATSSEATRAVHKGRQNGALIYAEVPAGALVGPSQTNPAILTKIPLREGSGHINDAIELLANGQLTMLVSDHCVLLPGAGTNFTRINKGATGVEERLMVLWEKAVTTGRIDPMRFVAVTSSNAAKTFNLYPRKGRIAVGADADLVVWDAKATRRLSAKSHLSKADSSIFESISVHAHPAATICAGKVIYKDGKHVGAIPGKGKFVQLRPNSPFIFSVVHLRENMNALSLGITDGTMNSSMSKSTDGVRPHSSTGARGSRGTTEPATTAKARTKVTHPPGGKSSGFW